MKLLLFATFIALDLTLQCSSWPHLPVNIAKNLGFSEKQMEISDPYDCIHGTPLEDKMKKAYLKCNPYGNMDNNAKTGRDLHTEHAMEWLMENDNEVINCERIINESITSYATMNTFMVNMKCFYSTLGWIDNNYGPIKNVITEDLAFLGKNVTNIINYDSITSCTDTIVDKCMIPEVPLYKNVFFTRCTIDLLVKACS